MAGGSNKKRKADHDDEEIVYSGQALQMVRF